MAESIRSRMETMVRTQQDAITAALTALDGRGRFKRDSWERPEGGGGTTCVMMDGAVFEKAGVGVSVVQGTLSPEAARAMGGGQGLAADTPLSFSAVGISLVLHPHNPWAPTVHANYRYFERGDSSAPAAWWFGGGADLTPAYLLDDDAAHFHRVHKDTCDRHDPAFYPRFKEWCDDYFLIGHRGERRGVGGIFFDDLHDRSAAALLAFVSDCAAAFLPAYMPIVERRYKTPFEESHRRWQQLRRGRYVEFNLVYDRGTTFGLRTQGRIESILMSLPLTARWEYDHAPEAGSPEAALLEAVRKPRSWV